MSDSSNSPFVTNRRKASRCQGRRSRDHSRISLRTLTLSINPSELCIKVYSARVQLASGKLMERLLTDQTRQLSSCNPNVPATQPVRQRQLWPLASYQGTAPRQPIPSTGQDRCAFPVPAKCPGEGCARHLGHAETESLFHQVPALPSTLFGSLLGEGTDVTRR